jgi:hypothetical protein
LPPAPPVKETRALVANHQVGEKTLRDFIEIRGFKAA